MTLAFCWAHLRRRVFDVVQDGPAPIASEALERIAALYAIVFVATLDNDGYRSINRSA
ncbi:IS66 family transposase [Bradyrhizobium sp. USDA 3364]